MPAGDQPLDGLFAADNHLPGLTVQPTFSSPHCPPLAAHLPGLYFVSPGRLAKSLTKVRINMSTSLICQDRNLFMEG